MARLPARRSGTVDRPGSQAASRWDPFSEFEELYQRMGQLMDSDWLKGVRDHVRTADIREVPADAQHRVIRRKQFKTSPERLRRRRMRRKHETAEQAAEAIPDHVGQRPTLPYVHLRSHSTAQPFCLFVAMGPLQSAPTLGPFNSYGLGDKATIPWF